jgi:hypothetical protein
MSGAQSRSHINSAAVSIVYFTSFVSDTFLVNLVGSRSL